MLRFGPAEGPVVVAAPALFEEGNRTRAFLVSVLRRLADRGVASVLPDVPGQGESLVETRRARLFNWREAFEALVDRLWGEHGISTGVSIRGGCLLDGFSLLPARWQLAPMTGEDVLEDLLRIARLTGFKGDVTTLIAADDDAPFVLAGNAISPILSCDLLGAEPYTPEYDVPIRVARMATDPRPADVKFDGPPLWRRSEAGTDDALATAVADDIEAWIAHCAG